jgi:hypothetical protein
MPVFRMRAQSEPTVRLGPRVSDIVSGTALGKCAVQI